MRTWLRPRKVRSRVLCGEVTSPSFVMWHAVGLKEMRDPGLVVAGLNYWANLGDSSDNCSCTLIQLTGKAGASGQDDGFKEGATFVCKLPPGRLETQVPLFTVFCATAYLEGAAHRR